MENTNYYAADMLYNSISAAFIYGIVGRDVTKRKSSHRTLPMSPTVETLLLPHKKPSGYICLNKDGKLLTPSRLTSKFKDLQRANNLREIRLHDLRHTCTALLTTARMPLMEVSRWLGHSSISITADLYGHLEFTSKEQCSTIFGGNDFHERNMIMDYNFDSMTNLFFTLSDVMNEYEEGNTDSLQNFYKAAMEKESIPAATDYADIYQEQEAVLHFIRWFYSTMSCIDLDDCTDALAIHLEDNFRDSDAAMINFAAVQHVLEVVDSIFPNYKNVVKNYSISILDAERKERNGESIAIMDEETERGAIFLYRMWNDFDGSFTPEAVLLHEMGHQLHFFLTKALNMVPDSFVPYLESIGTRPEALSSSDFLEVFADTFLLAVVHKTKEFGDPFPMINENTKTLCYAYISSLFGLIS